MQKLQEQTDENEQDEERVEGESRGEKAEEARHVTSSSSSVSE